MRQSNFLYKLIVLADRLNDKEFLEQHQLTRDSFILLLATKMMCESFQTDTINPKVIKSFLKNYMVPMGTRKFNSNMDYLHELNYVYINTLFSVTLTKVGEHTVNTIYEQIHRLDRITLRPILKTLQEGKYKINGLLTSLENMKRKKRNTATPYVGVKRIAPHRFNAIVKQDGVFKVIGTFTRPLAAAKARDSYIRKHKLFNLTFSL